MKNATYMQAILQAMLQARAMSCNTSATRTAVTTTATPTRPSSLKVQQNCTNFCPPRSARHARTLLAPRNKTALSSREVEQATWRQALTLTERWTMKSTT